VVVVLEQILWVGLVLDTVVMVDTLIEVVWVMVVVGVDKELLHLVILLILLVVGVEVDMLYIQYL
jgi:hypothetical protein